MNMRTFAIAGISALFGLCLAAMFAGSIAAQGQTPEGSRLVRPDLINDVQAPAAQPSPSKAGRFQMAPWFVDGKSELFMIIS